MPYLGLAGNGPLPKRSALKIDIRASVNGAIVAHEKPKVLWRCQCFSDESVKWRSTNLSGHRLKVKKDSGASFQVVDHPRLLSRFEFTFLGEQVEGEVPLFDQMFWFDWLEGRCHGGARWHNAIKYERDNGHPSWYETFIRLGSKGPNRGNYKHRYTRKTEVTERRRRVQPHAGRGVHS